MKNYKEFAKHIRDEIEYILNQSKNMTYESFMADQTLLRAFIRSVEVIGEASKHIPDHVKDKHPSVEWKKIAGTRDVLIHHYFNIDTEILWDIIKNKLGPLYLEIMKILNEE